MTRNRRKAADLDLAAEAAPRCIYSGRDRLGSVAPRSDRTWLARDRHGHPISVHDSMNEAATAVVVAARVRT